jgi:predicted component of type VI protein secretion system
VETRAELLLPDGTTRELAEDLSIGRAPANDLVLARRGISRRHALLLLREGRWFVEDHGSLHGTYLNSARLHPGIPFRLRHADRIGIAGEVLVFLTEGQLSDPDETSGLDDEGAQALARHQHLSPFQNQVVRLLCEPWLAGGSLADLPSNEEIAARLGTPDAAGSVKAALRRVYAKAGLASSPAATKRRQLCLLARRRGWI